MTDLDNVMKHGSSLYLYEIERKTWQDAADFCENIGYHLVSIGSMEEHEFVLELIENYIGTFVMETSYWIGLNDVGKQGNYVSSDGRNQVFWHWDFGSPSLLYIDERCISVIRYKEAWTNIKCSEMLSFVCEKSESE